MNREEASEALSLLRKVVEQARDEAALSNWGPVWIAHAFINGAGFVATDMLLRTRGPEHVTPYVVLWTGVVAMNLVAVLALKQGGGGARSFVETQIWLIWTAFMCACALVCVLNFVMGTDRIFAGVAMGVLSAYGFAMMGGLMGRRWYAWSALYATGATAAALRPHWQFTILGVLWAVSQLAGGIWLIVEKRRVAAGPRVV